MKFIELTESGGELFQHKNIGVDVDDTLIDGNYNKHQLQRFIMDYYLEKNFYLITFRIGYYVDNVWADIAYDNDQLTQDMFKGVWGVPEELSNGARKYVYHLKNKHRWVRYDDEEMANVERLAGLYQEYREWKGKKCHELGCTILIDDMTNDVIDGCKKYGVKLIHPDTVEYNK
jgi:hypothetical protein